MNFAINRQQIIQNVYSGEAAYTSYVPPGYGPWPIKEADLKRKYAKYDLPAAKKLMADAGASKGFSVDMTIVNLQDYPSVAALLVQQMKQINIDVNIKARDRHLRVDLQRRDVRLVPQRPRHARRRRRLRAGVPPCFGDVRIRPAYRNLKAWRAIGNGRIQLADAKRRPMYLTAQQALWDDPIQMPLVAIRKYQVFNRRVRNMYVASATSTRASERRGWRRKRDLGSDGRGAARRRPSRRRLEDTRWERRCMPEPPAA